MAQKGPGPIPANSMTRKPASGPLIFDPPDRESMPSIRLPRPGRDELDLLHRVRIEQKPLDIDARKMNRIGIEASGRDDLFHLDDASPASGRHRPIEVARGLAEQTLACLVRLARKRAVQGKCVSERVDLGGRGVIKK